MFGTIASRFNDDGVTALYQHLRVGARPAARNAGTASTPTCRPARPSSCPRPASATSRTIADTVRRYHAETAERVARARRRQHLLTAKDVLGVDVEDHLPGRDPLLDEWPDAVEAVAGEVRDVAVGDARSRGWRSPATRTTASCSGSSGARTCPAGSRSPPGCSPSSARTRTRRACSRAKGARRAPTAGSTCWPRASPRRVCRPRSTP